MEEGGVFEQEVQKSESQHKVNYRPDLILHIPFERGRTDSRKHGNSVVIELKVRATEAEAREDYEKLATMCDRLEYPLGVFINIDANDARRGTHKGAHQDRLFGFAVRLVDGAVGVVGPVARTPNLQP